MGRSHHRIAARAPGEASGQSDLDLRYRQGREGLPTPPCHPDSEADDSVSSATHLAVSAEDLRAPDETKPASTPVVHQGELTIAITSRVGTRKSDDAPNGPTSIDVKHCHLIDLDHDPPSDEV